jgi:hypothetical protein
MLWTMDDGVDLRRIGPRQLVSEKRRWNTERLGGAGGAGAHRWWLIWLGKLADAAEFGMEFRRLEAKSAKEKKGRRGRRRRGFYRGSWLGERAKVSRGFDDGWWRWCRARPGHWLEVEREADTWAPDVSGREERRSVTLWGFARLGLGPKRSLGRNGPRRPLFYFLISFLFSIFWFLNCFIYFANLLQINSNKFLGSSTIHYSVLNQ